jgi:transposase
MAMGQRETEEQRELFVMSDKLPRSPGHVFYDKLNRVLREGGFDAHIESICEPFYAQGPAFGAARSLLSHVAGWLL